MDSLFVRSNVVVTEEVASDRSRIV